MHKKRGNKSKIILFLVVSLLCGHNSSILLSQSVNWDKVESKSATNVYKKLKNSYLHPRWIDGTSYFFYHLEEEGKPNKHMLVNAKTGKQEELITDTEAFLKDYAILVNDSAAIHSDFRLYNIRFENNRNRSKLVINYKDTTLLYNRKSGKLSLFNANKKQGPTSSEKTKDSSQELFPKSHPVYEVISRNDSLFCTNIQAGEEWLIEARSNEKEFQRQSKFWVGDYYVEFRRIKSPNLEEMGVIESLTEGRPRVRTFDMPFPGEDNFPKDTLFCYDPTNRQVISVDISKYANEEIRLAYYHSKSRLYFDRKSRTGEDIELFCVDLPTGKVTTLIHEDTAPQYNRTLFNYRFIKGGKEILWWSERDGYGKYYLYSSDGELIQPLFKDPTRVAGRIVRVDEDRNELLCIATGGSDIDNPYYGRYFRVPLDGRGERRIADVPIGEEELTLSPNNRYGFLKVSRPDLTPQFYIVDMHTGKSHFVYALPEEDAYDAGWVKPRMLSLLAADNKTKLYGLMYLPSDFDANKKYPIISYVYPGPQTDLMPLSFTIDDTGNQSLAEVGFVVIQVPPRGSSPLRGKDFYTFSANNLRDYPLEDIKTTIERLAEEYDFIDLEKVGIYGHSGGGFAALTSMLTYPDFYKACVAASGNYDNNIYIQWWGESFHGIEEVVDPETQEITYHSKIPTTMELAENLNGPLLLITGDQDRNVPPSNTYRMAHALMEAGKGFDMLIMPGFDHGLDGPYYFNKIRYFFLEHLLGEETDHINILEHK